MNTPGSNKLFQAAFEMQHYFQKQNWPFCFIGGLAVLRWGEFRMTQDIDLCLQCGYGYESPYITSLLNHFKARISNMEEFSRQNRVILLFTSNGIKVDITLSGLPYEEQMIERASYFEYTSGCSLVTCSVEDLLIQKAFADRLKDWLDIEGIIARNKNEIDKKIVLDQLSLFSESKDTTEIIQKLDNMF